MESNNAQGESATQADSANEPVQNQQPNGEPTEDQRSKETTTVQQGNENETNAQQKSDETVAPTTAPVMSKRAQKRQKKQLEQQEKKKQKKARIKQAKQVVREKKREEKEKWFSTLPPEEQEKQREKRTEIVKSRLLEKQQLMQRLERAMTEGLRVVFDCSFAHLMHDREAVSLDRQLQYSYNFNKTLANPMQMHFASVLGRTETIMAKIVGLANWKVHIHKEDVCDLFDTTKLVYLTADSPHVLDVLSKDDVYVIGAFVDRNRHKGATYNKAQEHGLRTARLPLTDHVDMEATKVLTVNHVFAILGLVHNGTDWHNAILEVLPGRKGARDRSSTSNQQDGDDGGDDDGDDDYEDGDLGIAGAGCCGGGEDGDGNGDHGSDDGDSGSDGN